MKGFIEALYACFEVVGQKRPSDLALKMWLAAIETAKISEQDAIKALQAHMFDPDSGQFAPKPADIIKQMQGTKTDKRAALEAAAVVQWGRVIRNLGKVGTYRSVVFDDPRTMVAVQALGGWSRLGEMDHSDIEFRAADFRRAYCADSVKPPRILYGRGENRTPVLIGDKKECERVMLTGCEPADFGALPGPRTAAALGAGIVDGGAR